DLPYACGLGTGGFFEADVAPALHMSDGALDVVAVEPEPERLDALRADPDRIEWWCERVRRCRTVLAGRGLCRPRRTRTVTARNRRISFPASQRSQVSHLRRQ